MKIPAILSLALMQASPGDESLVRNSEPRSPQAELAALQVPEGFEIQLFASEPLINKPINIAHDKQGRLWVSSTTEYPYAAAKDRWSDPLGTRVRDSRDAIKILEDTNGDGHADKVTNFADGLNIPTGVLPWHQPEHQDGCIAWSIPNIWYFADTTGDGKADHREVLFGPLGYEKDTHGMCSSFRMGPNDGWVYATHGFNNTSTLTAKDGTSVELNSGNVFRFRPDGSSVEVFSRGQVNPFGLTFDRRGNLYSADCHSAPVYQLLRGGIYPSFGKPHDGLGFAPTMIEHTHGSTGICGIAYLDRDYWGLEWNDHLLIGNPVTSRINHDRIEFRGSTPVAIEQKDFLTSEDLWFRPVDMTMGHDGALYVADFYNRIIGHYEVPLTHPGRDRERGRIWKISKKGHHAPLTPPVHTPLIRDLLAALQSPDPFTQRQAAHTLQFQPKEEALKDLLETLARTPKQDTHLIHVLRMAIRNHLTSFPNSIHIASPHTSLLDDIIPAVPTAQAAFHLAKSPGKRSHLSHIARYGDDLILNNLITELAGQNSLETQLAELDALQAGLDERGQLEPPPALLDWAQALAARLLEAHQKLESSGWTELPHPDHPESASPWSTQQRQCRDGQNALIISSLRHGEQNAEQRTGLLKSKPFTTTNQLSFWIVGHRGSPDQEAHRRSHLALIDASGKEIHRAYPPRNDIAQKVIWKTEAGRTCQLVMTDGDDGEAYAWLGLTRIEGVASLNTDSFASNNDLDVQLTKLAELLKFQATVTLRDQLKPWLPEPPPVVKKTIPNGPEQKRLENLIEQRVSEYESAKRHKTLDSQQGVQLFQTHCASCHQIKHKGGLIGPQLDGIGSRGVQRLAEDILDPNRNVDSHFHLTNFTFKDGTTGSAFVTAEQGNVLHLRDLTGETKRLPKSQIKSRHSLPVSLMPPTFGETLTSDDFTNLIAWLLHQA
ncbi:PVC-type heme-binding CxxCH protein [Verrucomicrobiaceae bacterium 227]